jgi:hypothetical protein
MSDTESMRLSKRMSELGLASRREADEWIERGWVQVDGAVAILGLKVLPHQVITIDPRARREQARRLTVILHKPMGYVSAQAEEGHTPASVLVTLENQWHEARVFTGKARGAADGAGAAFRPRARRRNPQATARPQARCGARTCGASRPQGDSISIRPASW